MTFLIKEGGEKMKKKLVAHLLGIAVLLCGLFLMNARQENTALAAENVFEMTPGGSIRIAEPYGLRFQVRMSADIKESADKVGMLIFPADYLVNSGADGDVYYESVEALANTSVTKHRMDLDLTSKVYEQDDYWYGNGAIVNIKGNNMAREFVGIAYYEVDGEKIFADTGKMADTTRSAAQVALLSSADKNNTYSEETNKLLSDYMDYLKVAEVEESAPSRYKVRGFAADNGLRFHVEQYVDNLVSAGNAWTEQTHLEAQVWQHNMGQGAEHGFSIDTYCAFWLDGSSWFNNYTNIQNVTNDVTIVDRGEDYADGYRYAISYDIFIAFENNVGSPDGPYAYVQFKHHMPGESEKGFMSSYKELRDGNRYLWQDSCGSYAFRKNGLVNKDGGETYSTDYSVVTCDNEAKYSWIYMYRADGLKITVDVTDEEIYDSASDFGYNDNIEFTIQKNTVADSLEPNNSFNMLVTLGESDQKWARYANSWSTYGDNIYSNLSNNGIVKVEKTVKENGVIVEIFLDYSIWGIDYNQAVGNMTTLMASRNGDAQGNSLFRFFERQGAIWNKANTASRIEKNGKLVNNYYELPDMEELVKNSTEYQEGETLDNSMAVLSASNKKALVREYKQGAQLFNDRDYMVHEDGLPSELVGKSYFRFNIEDTQAITVEQSGYVIAAAPGEGEFGDRIATRLLDYGFVKIADDMPVLGYVSTNGFITEKMSYYVKWCKSGETYEFSKWCVLIFASQDEYESDYWMSEAATVIKLDTKELKEKYAPSTRLWQGIPSITSVDTENGTRLWVSWFTGKDREPRVGNYAVYYYSDDNGENWNPAFVVTFNYDVVDNSRVYDPTIFTDDDNNLYLWWNQTNYSFGSGSVWYSIIENADGDFSDMKAKTPVNTSTGLKLNKPIILSTGEWLYAAHDMDDRTAAKVYSSSDKGVTWTLKGAAVIGNANNFFEPTIVEVLDDDSDDVTLMMWNRCTESYMRSISYSHDGGKTWSEAKEFSIEGIQYQGPSSRQNSLAFTYNGKNYIAYAHHYDTESRNNMCLFLSDDGGKTFAYRMMLDRNSGVAYPDIRYVDEKLYVVWDYNRYDEKRMFMAEITMDDLLASTGLQEIDPANIKVISSLTVGGMTLNLGGTVTDSKGNPIAGATVVVGENSVTTNQDGYYSFKNIDADISVIAVSKEGYFSQEINVTDKELIDSEFNYVANVSLESKQNVNVTGNVVGMYGEAISGAKVSLDETEVTTTNGTFEFENIVPKEDATHFTLTVEKEGYATRSYQIAYGEFKESNNYCVNLQDCKLLTEGTTDLGLLGGTGTSGSNTATIPEYQVYLTRNDTGVVIEAITDSKLTSGGLDRLEIFMNVHNYSTSGRGAQTVLFNVFSNGFIRAWNWPSNTKKQMYSGQPQYSWEYNGVTVKNTVTISDTGKNKFAIEIPYAFFDLLVEQQFGLEGLSANYSKDKYGVGKNTPLGISMLSGYKVNNQTWYSDSWYYNDIPDLASQNIGTIVYKNYPSDLAIVTPECKVAQKYSVYADSLLSSFGILDSYVQSTNVGVEGKNLANNMAKFDATGHSLVKFKPGQYIFSNRTLHVVPEECTEALKELTFIYDPVDAVTTVKITQSGYLLLMVDDNALTSEYLKDWNCIIRSSVTKHGINTGGRGVSMYAIWAEEGDTITIPTNAVIFTNNM